MRIAERIEAFAELGKKLDNIAEEELENISGSARAKNGWFTADSIRNGLEGISFMLKKEKLEKWVANHRPTEVPKIVGIVMAGNIPLVGFHDLLCVLISGHFAAVKPSSDDEILTKKIVITTWFYCRKM